MLGVRWSSCCVREMGVYLAGMVELSRTLVTRGYEMDARERIPAAVLARYMEHLRWRAVHGEELGLRSLFAEGHSAVVRAQQLHLGMQLQDDEDLVLDLRIGHVGRSSLCFVQRVLRSSDRQEAARADVVIVVLGADGRPAPVPDAVRRRVVPLQLLDRIDPGERPTDAWCRAVPIRPSDLDVLQHVNQSRYVEMVDDTLQLAVAAGVQPFEGPAQHEAVRVSPKRISIAYERETRVGDDLQVFSWPSGAGQADFELCRASDGAPVARARALF